MPIRHFLRDDDLTHEEYLRVIKTALEFKKNRFFLQPLKNKSGENSGCDSVAVIFDKNSTRTRASFSIGVAELGGYPLVIDSASSQLSRGEPISDTAHVLERMVKAIVWRTFGQENVEEMAKNSSVPVVNALTDEFHPCQILADLACAAFLKGGVFALENMTLTYFGDGANNMAASYLLGCATAGVNVKIACPENYSPNQRVIDDARKIALENGSTVEILAAKENATSDSAREIAMLAARDSDIITTDAWLSMGMDKSEEGARAKAFLPFQVNAELMENAKKDAIFLHCLPAYRGNEVTADVIDGGQSAVFEEAEFRLHAQKALLTFLLEKSNQQTVETKEN